MEPYIKIITDYISNNSEIWLESPRKSFFGGKSEKAQKFKLSFKPSKRKIIIEFESGTKLGIELFRIEKALQYLMEQNSVVRIGATLLKNSSNDSLESYLKRITNSDTKTAPHVVDLLVLTDLAELKFTTSHKNRTVHGVKLINTFKESD